MRFNIEEFRKMRAEIQKGYPASVDDLLSGTRLDYQIEIRSSSMTMEPLAIRSRKKLAEALIDIATQLQAHAVQEAGHQAIYVYARPTGTTAEYDLVSVQKYSLFQEAWVHLSGFEFPYERLNPQALEEALIQFEAEFTDPIDDPEVDDDPTPTGQRKRQAWREKADELDSEEDPEDEEDDDEEEEPKPEKAAASPKPKPKAVAKKSWDLPTTVMGASRTKPG